MGVVLLQEETTPHRFAQVGPSLQFKGLSILSLSQKFVNIIFAPDRRKRERERAQIGVVNILV